MLDDSRQRELRAAEVRASIEHPNLLPARLVRDRRRQRVGLELKKPSAPRLDEILASRRLTGRDCLQILYGVAHAVDALAEHGLVASNLAPSRILVDAKRGGILADPGMPSDVRRRPRREDEDPEAVYRSPEERDARPIDVRSNVYSLGVILSTALTGAPPTGLRRAPTAIDAVIAWATDGDPARRYPSAQEFVFAAADALAAPAPDPASAEAEATPAKRRQGSTRSRQTPPAPRSETIRPRRSSAEGAPAKAKASPESTDPRPAPDKPRARLLAWPRVVIAGAVLAAALTGLLLGRSGGDETQPSRIASSALALRLPPGWVQTKAVGDTGRLLSDPVAAAPANEEGVGIVAGRVRKPVVATRLLSAQGGGRPAGTRLGRLETWQYKGLRLRPNLVGTAYLAPTTGEPLLVICHAPVHDAGLRLPECERMASTITLKGESGVQLAAIEGRENRLQSVMRGLHRDRLAARRRLARARLASQQADAARRLEVIYRRAAGEVADTARGPGPATHQALTRSLRATADAYRRLARAAEAVDRSRYRAATEVVRESEAAVLRKAAEPSFA